MMRRNVLPPSFTYLAFLMGLVLMSVIGTGRGLTREFLSGTPAYIPMVQNNYPNVLTTPSPTTTLTPTATNTLTLVPPLPTATSSEVITSTTLYLWPDGLLEAEPGSYVIQHHTCYTGCRKAERWDASLMGDMVGKAYVVFGKFIFNSVLAYSVPFRIILVHEGVEQILVEHTLTGPGSKELNYIAWDGPDPAAVEGDSLVFEIDVRDEIGTLEIHYLGEGSSVRVPAVMPSPEDTRFWNNYALEGSADAVYARDMDKDGDIDVVGVDNQNRDINWWENDGSQTFTRHQIDNSLDIPPNNSVHAADLNGDGHVDVLATVDWSSDNEVAWYENDGLSSFTKHLLETNYVNPKTVQAIDLDKNGDMDILGGGDKLVWWVNDGGQGFAQQLIDDAVGQISSISAVYLDQDGDFDLLGASTSGSIYWWQNNGSQAFTRYVIRVGDPTTTGSRSWASGVDLDGDGDIDVVGTAALGNDIAWWENDGDQNYAEHKISFGLGNPTFVSAVDVNKDGSLDILAAGAAIAWWENLGDQRFVRHTISTSEAYTIFPVDIDKDGDVDFVKSNSLLLWYANQP